MWMSDQGFVPGPEIALENLPVSLAYAAAQYCSTRSQKLFYSKSVLELIFFLLKFSSLSSHPLFYHILLTFHSGGPHGRVGKVAEFQGS